MQLLFIVYIHKYLLKKKTFSAFIQLNFDMPLFRRCGSVTGLQKVKKQNWRATKLLNISHEAICFPSQSGECPKQQQRPNKTDWGGVYLHGNSPECSFSRCLCCTCLLLSRPFPPVSDCIKANPHWFGDAYPVLLTGG